MLTARRFVGYYVVGASLLLLATLYLLEPQAPQLSSTSHTHLAGEMDWSGTLPDRLTPCPHSLSLSALRYPHRRYQTTGLSPTTMPYGAAEKVQTDAALLSHHRDLAACVVPQAPSPWTLAGASCGRGARRYYHNRGWEVPGSGVAPYTNSKAFSNAKPVVITRPLGLGWW